MPQDATGQPLTVYKDTRSIQISPDAYDAAVAKGWKLNKPQVGGSAGQEFMSGMGMVPQEDAKNMFKHPIDTAKGMLKGNEDLLKRSGSELQKGDYLRGGVHGIEGMIPMLGPQLAHQGDMLESGNFKGAAGNMAGMATTMGLGEGMGAALGPKGAAMPKTGFGAVEESLSKQAAVKSSLDPKKIAKGTHADVLQQLEHFRQTVRAKPSAKQMDVARMAHDQLAQRVDTEWNNVYSKMQNKPTDAYGIEKVLSEMRKIDPETEKWIKTHIEPSKTGQSVTAPLWGEVQRLQSRLGIMMKNPKLDPVVRGEIKNSIDGLRALAYRAADDAGVGQKYMRAQQLTRKLENIKYHTAYNAQLIKPSAMYGIGGAVGGIMAGSGMGISGELGSAFVGKMLGSEAGKLLTPKGTYKIPKASIEGERFVWKQLGEKPPKGALAKKVKPSELNANNAAFMAQMKGQQGYNPKAGELAPNLQSLWQEGAFGKKPEGDIGAKVRAKNPEPTRAEVKTAAKKAVKKKESGLMGPDE